MQLFIMPCLQFAHNWKLEILVTALSHYDCDDSTGYFADNKIIILHKNNVERYQQLWSLLYNMISHCF